jgi:hypothetical protein
MTISLQTHTKTPFKLIFGDQKFTSENDSCILVCDKPVTKVIGPRTLSQLNTYDSETSTDTVFDRNIEKERSKYTQSKQPSIFCLISFFTVILIQNLKILTNVFSNYFIVFW